MFSVYTSQLGDKYVVGIATAGAAGAKKVAKKLTDVAGNFIKIGYVSGTLGVALDWDEVDEYSLYLNKAYQRGETLADDIKTEKKYYFQKTFNRIINVLFLKRVMKKIFLNIKTPE